MGRFDTLPTPCYVLDEELLARNLNVLGRVKRESGCKILLAQKAFSMWSVYPLLAETLDGTTASGLYEAKLGAECFGGETHVFSPCYSGEFPELLRICNHIVFNSFSEWEKHRVAALSAGASCGIRVNPEHSTQGEHAIYDPCAPGSRLGVTEKNFRPDLLEGVEGLHFHTLCEQNSDALEETFAAFKQKFGTYLSRMKWLNLGGGHHITRADYDVARLIRLIARIRETYGVTVYLEPGEAVVLNAGFLVSSVLGTVENGITTAILDASAACHMPDVLEMPYRPQVEGAGKPGENRCDYRLAGNTCLAGDVIGDYSFDEPLTPGKRLVFCDMALYSMVKNNTFNGMPLPSIAIRRKDGTCEVVKRFGYEDFKNRLS